MTKDNFRNPSHCHCSDRQYLGNNQEYPSGKSFLAVLTKRHFNLPSPAHLLVPVLQLPFVSSSPGCPTHESMNNKKAKPGPLTWNHKTMDVSRTKPMSHGTMLVYFLNSFQQTIHCHLPRVARWRNGRYRYPYRYHLQHQTAVSYQERVRGIRWFTMTLYRKVLFRNLKMDSSWSWKAESVTFMNHSFKSYPIFLYETPKTAELIGLGDAKLQVKWLQLVCFDLKSKALKPYVVHQKATALAPQKFVALGGIVEIPWSLLQATHLNRGGTKDYNMLRSLCSTSCNLPMTAQKHLAVE